MNYPEKIEYKKNYVFVLVYFILVSIFLSCSNKNLQIESDELIRKSDFCSSNKEHGYEIYIPSASKKCNTLPQLIILDPHGKGKSAIELFIPAAEKYKFILIASNLIKNNTSDFNSYINELRKDVHNKYPVNEQVVIAGFSGGARMAITYAQYNKINGVIACGALASHEQISAANALVYGIIGMVDFNFIEEAQYLFSPDNAPDNLRIEFTKDLHNWPSAGELSRLLGHIYFEKEFTTQKCLKFNNLIDEYLTSQDRKSAEFISSGEFIDAYLLLQNLTYVDVFNNSDAYLKIYNSVNYEDKLNDQLNLLKESIRFELQVRDSYYKELIAKDSLWWKHEISSLNTKIRNEKKKYDAFAYRRIKAFLGIMCYSLTNNALQNSDLQTASRILPVYAYLEPENPDMFYFRALYYNRIGNSKESQDNLHKAIKTGFSDKEKIEDLKSSF
jgi:hypothetical protein